MLRFLADPSGGLRYHWRACTAHARWTAFRRDLRNFMRPWLETQQKMQRPVLLVGPSGGYTLPWAELQQISTLCAVEPDPVARLVLRQRCRHIQIDARPALGWEPSGYQSKAIEAWFARYPEHALVFCNLLGQLQPGQSDLSASWQHRFRAQLRGRAWLSYHDLASCPARPDLEYLKTRWQDPGWRAPELDPNTWQGAYPQARGPLHLVDHGTAQLFAPLRPSADTHALFAWPIIPDRWHVIEGLASATDGRGCAETANVLG